MIVVSVVGEGARTDRVRAILRADALVTDGVGSSPQLVVLVAKGDGQAEVRSAVSEQLAQRIVVCPERRDPRRVRKLVDLGSDGVVWDGDLDTQLATVVRTVLAGQICVPRDARRRLHRPELTNREKQVLSLVVMGLSNSEIAGRLFVSEATVKSHLSASFRKLGVGSRAEAARILADPAEGFGTGVLSIL